MRAAFLCVVLLGLGCSGVTGGTGTDDGGGGPGLDGGNSPPTDDAGNPLGDGGTLASGCGSGGGGPTGGPADLFPCANAWYRDVSGLSASANSSAVITKLAGKGFGPDSGPDPHKLQVTFDFTLLHANASTPHDAVTVVDYPDESDLSSTPNHGYAAPTPAGGYTEGVTSYTCNRDQDDCHTLVVDDAKHVLYELYASSLADGTWQVSNESVWNLDHAYGNAERGYACTSADASGMAVSPGLIGLREVLAAAKETNGVLHHALRLVLPNDRIEKAWVAPATHYTGAASAGSNGMPYGARLRLKAGFDESKVTSAGARVIVRTLKKYGMILADGGNISFTAETDRWYHAQDASLTWTGTLDARDFDALGVDDFELVDFDESTHHQPSGADDCHVLTAPLAGLGL